MSKIYAWSIGPARAPSEAFPFASHRTLGEIARAEATYRKWKANQPTKPRDDKA